MRKIGILVRLLVIPTLLIYNINFIQCGLNTEGTNPSAVCIFAGFRVHFHNYYFGHLPIKDKLDTAVCVEVSNTFKDLHIKHLYLMYKLYNVVLTM